MLVATVRKGLVHLENSSEGFDASGQPATSAFAATSSEEEGLHARPLPHTYGECTSALTLRTTEEEGLMARS